MQNNAKVWFKFTYKYQYNMYPFMYSSPCGGVVGELEPITTVVGPKVEYILDRSLICGSDRQITLQTFIQFRITN